jgi:hypothetical protein
MKVPFTCNKCVKKFEADLGENSPTTPIPWKFIKKCPHCGNDQEIFIVTPEQEEWARERFKRG